MRTVFKSSVIMIIILVIVSCTNIASPSTTPTTATSTAYIPVSMGTPIPLTYKSIAPETAHELNLLARWRIDLPVDNLVFASNRDILCSGNSVVLQSWDMFIGEVDSTSPNCHIPITYSNLGTKAISSDDHFSVKTDSGFLEIRNQLRPSTGLYFYLDNVSSVGFSSDGEYLVTAFQNGQVWFIPKSKWEGKLLALEDGDVDDVSDLVSDLPELIIDVGKAPLQIQFSPNNSLMAFLFEDQTIQLWNVSGLSLYSTINDSTAPTPQEFVQSSSDILLKYKIAFSPNNQIMATASRDNDIRLWDVRTGKLLVQLKGYQDNPRVNALVFSPTARLLAALYNGNWIYVWGILPDDLDKAQVDATAIAESVLNSTVSKASFPNPTITPTSGLPAYQSQAPLTWSVPMPTTEQIKEARDCSVELLATSRYPEKMSYGELENAYSLKSSCEWAALAVAYRSHSADKDSVSEEGKRAFFQVIRQNPAFALTMPLFYSYFNSMELVDAPPSARQPITSIVIDYDWSGIGDPSHVSYHIKIDKAHLPIGQIKLGVQAQPAELKNNAARSIDPEKIQKLGKALTDFLPVQSPFTLESCTDNKPDWKINLSFLDGAKLTLTTHGSNLFTVGGPWYTELDGQNYIQYSSALVNAVLDLFESLNLPLGQPAATFCKQTDTFELAFP